VVEELGDIELLHEAALREQVGPNSANRAQ
jgi:hypothetical protein